MTNLYIADMLTRDWTHMYIADRINMYIADMPTRDWIHMYTADMLTTDRTNMNTSLQRWQQKGQLQTTLPCSQEIGQTHSQ